MFPRKTSDRKETQMRLLKVTMETGKNVIEKFLGGPKSLIIPKLFRLLSTTIRTATLF